MRLSHLDHPLLGIPEPRGHSATLDLGAELFEITIGASRRGLGGPIISTTSLVFSLDSGWTRSHIRGFVNGYRPQPNPGSCHVHRGARGRRCLRSPLMAILAPGMTLYADSGGRVCEPQRPIVGADTVARVFLSVWKTLPRPHKLLLGGLNSASLRVRSVVKAWRREGAFLRRIGGEMPPPLVSFARSASA